MNRSEHNPEALLDAAIAEIATEPIENGIVEEAGRRAWARIMAEAATEREAEAPAPQPVQRIRGCADFQALMPDYRAGRLSPARRMLLEDHTHECVACRRVLHPETMVAKPAKIVEMPRRAWSPARWAIAAAITVGVASMTWSVYQRFGPAPAGSRATVLTADGGVFRLTGGALEPVSAGAQFAEAERLRTAAGGHAVIKLIDGSTVEVSDRAEFSVNATRRDTTVYLGRGRIIVQAAKRNSGHLYIATGDSRVAVTGTVFSVNRGLAGTRVAVIEGEVEVERPGEDVILHPGDQTTTHPSLAKGSLTDEIAWSRNFDKHMALLHQIADLKQKIDAVHLPGLRYASRLMDAVPADTRIYIALPNLGRAIEDVERLVKQQADQSPEMRAWIEKDFPQFERVTRAVSGLSNYIGEEIVFAAGDCKSDCSVFIADVTRPGLKEFLTAELSKMENGKALEAFRFVETPEAAAAAGKNLVIAFAANRVYVGAATAVAQAMRGGSQFATTPFGQTVGEVYKRGAGILVAADVNALTRTEPSPSDKSAFSAIGIDQIKYLIAEQRSLDDNRTEYSASVNFDSARRGIASWIAQPGPMGSLGFVSDRAQFAAAAVVKSPSQMLGEFIVAAGGKRDMLSEFRNVSGVDLEKDIVGALGSEVAFAFDGPMLPMPSWKLVVEVNDPVKLQASIAKLVDATNAKLQQHGQPTLQITESDSVNRPSQGIAVGRTAANRNYTIKLSSPLVPEISYTFIDGYMLAAPSVALLDQTISNRMSGLSLVRSRRFTRLLPKDSRPNFSAVVYQNAGDILSLLAKSSGAMPGVTPEQQKRAEELAGKIEPMLVCVYGESDRIEVASQGSAMNLLTQSFAGQLFGRKAHSRGTMPPRNAYR